ncbi:Acyltransferase family [[Clostridium] cf. saccharolyticum K10]|nr:Acyltransferase family [[Clostridium] cf. saccharolyticum K10]
MIILKAEQSRAVDVAKFTCAIFVIGIHSKFSSFFDSNIVSTFVDGIFDLAVPFFFVASGYFLGRKIKEEPENWESIFRNYFVRFFKMYVLWSLIYIPLTIYGEVQWRTPFFRACIKLLRNYLFVGINFYSWQLWYLLASCVAILILWLCFKMRMSLPLISVICILVYIMGIVLSLNSNSTNLFIKIYMAIFTTPRNGIFVGFPLITFGLVLNYLHIEKMSQVSIALICSLASLAYLYFATFLAGSFITSILLSVASVSCFVFLMSIRGNCKEASARNVYFFLRKMSTYIYCLHMYFVAIFRVFIMGGNENYNELICFIFVTFWAVITSGLLTYMYDFNISRKSKVSR